MKNVKVILWGLGAMGGHQHGDEQRAHGAAFDFVHACASFLLRDGSRTTKLAPRRVSAALM